MYEFTIALVALIAFIASLRPFTYRIKSSLQTLPDDIRQYHPNAKFQYYLVYTHNIWGWFLPRSCVTPTAVELCINNDTWYAMDPVDYKKLKTT